MAKLKLDRSELTRDIVEGLHVRLKAKSSMRPRRRLHAGRGSGSQGYMPGLAKHIAHLVGSDPHFHTKCTKNAEVIAACAKYGYDINALCAVAHKHVTGIWPGEHAGKNPTGVEADYRPGKRSPRPSRKEFNKEREFLKQAKSETAQQFEDDFLAAFKGGCCADKKKLPRR